MDLNTLSLDELKKLKRDVEKAITSFEERRLLDARKKLEDYAKEIGVDLNEVVALKKVAKNVNPPKYRNPTDATQTWTGRGRKPKWILEAVDAGKDIASFEIQM